MTKLYMPYLVDTSDDPTHGDMQQAQMCEVVHGDYVLASDYATLAHALAVANDGWREADKLKLAAQNQLSDLEATLTRVLARFIVLADAVIDPVYVEMLPEVIAARAALNQALEPKREES